ncbi:MAG TPA: tetratricopeptide repeat protein [Terriglobia bacterium]
MDNERVQFLRDSISASPGDTFARYALALELTRGGQSTEAWEHFQYLLDHHADYAPTYYQAGNLLANQGRSEEARAVFLRGIEVTRRLGQKHAESELRAALEAVE